jgi:uncharacterized protein (UPF0276 family)
MGGEQYACLVFGPKVPLSIENWMLMFGLVDKKEFSIRYVKENLDIYGEELDENDYEGIEIVFLEKFQECVSQYKKKFYDFLKDYGMTIFYDNNVYWGKCYLGMNVPNYETIDHCAMNRIKELCNNYNIMSPTFFGGIRGEFE